MKKRLSKWDPESISSKSEPRQASISIHQPGLLVAERLSRSRFAMNFQCVALCIALLSAGVAPISANPPRLDPEKGMAEWRSLFDGKTISGWHTFNKPGVDPRWSVSNGELILSPS